MRFCMLDILIESSQIVTSSAVKLAVYTENVSKAARDLEAMLWDEDNDEGDGECLLPERNGTNIKQLIVCTLETLLCSI